MKELEQDLKSGKYKNIYLFYGEEVYLKSSFESRFKESILESSAFGDMNISIFDDKTMDIDAFNDAVMTVPFMANNRLVLVKYTGLFSGVKKGADVDKLAKTLEHIPSSTVVIFVEDTIDKRLKLYKSTSKLGFVAEFKTPKEKEIRVWVAELFKQANKNIAPDVIAFFVNTVSFSMEAITLEVDKLIAYKDNESDITIQDIELISTKSLEVKIFDMLKAVGEKNLDKVLEIYNNMISAKESPIMILTMLARQFRLILRTKALLRETNDINYIAQQLDTRSFVVKECLEQAKNFKFDTLIEALTECLELDFKIKTGRISDKLGLEVLLIKYGGSA